MPDPIKVKPYDLVPRIFMLGGKPMNVKNYPYLRAIYNTRAHEVGLFTGRQVSKSTTLATKLVMKAITAPGSSQLYVAPLQDQTDVFSLQRLREFLYDSPVIKNGFFSGSGVVDQVHRKQLNNGSTISCGYAQRTADRLRGRSASDLYFDELQDILPEVMPVIKQLAFRVEDPSYWYCGTPKSMNNGMERERARSTGNEWAVKCGGTGCKKWNYRWTEKNIGNTGVICEFCGGPLDTDSGQWVAARKLDIEKGKDARVTMESYRIPQLICKPIMDNPFKWQELLTHLRDDPTALFYNEVLGLPFDSGAQPVTLEQLGKCCDSSRMNSLPDVNDPKTPYLVMGVDWAFVGQDSFTVVTVGGWAPFPTKFKLYYVKIYKGSETDTEYQERDILRIAAACKIKMIGTDWGCGQVQNIHLINELGEEKVAQMFHTGMNASGRRTVRAAWEPKTRKWHLARTAVLTDTFESIRRQQIEFPRYEDCTEMFNHILAESMEYNPKTNTSRYVNVLPDDCLHSLTYCMLAGELMVKGDFAGHTGHAETLTTAQTARDNPDENDGWGVSDDMYQS